MIVELNIAGLSFRREIPDLRRKTSRYVRIGPRAIHWLNSHAA
jgi:hypothetical protein